MRASPLAIAVTAAVCILPAAPAGAQVDPIEAELDAFWAEVSRTVAEWDLEDARLLPDPVQ